MDDYYVPLSGGGSNRSVAEKELEGKHSIFNLCDFCIHFYCSLNDLES